MPTTVPPRASSQSEGSGLTLVAARRVRMYQTVTASVEAMAKLSQWCGSKLATM
ncbi:MAG TPA: hypothetical protein VFE18_16140 [Phenylobacterium sp.]|uniref:hypothetical protein n=1 Tax=Phenylobacterium sp. TaxID=1871053 RepID=UPI002D616382|nr:hypothetical protein [Phenylobacterium sp.]HZZ69703.1 hypothetical protein [Phenylobacterium sp.]